MPGGLFDSFSHLVITIQVEDICNKIQRILIVLNFCVETSKVKSISQVVLVNLAEIFVSS